MHHPNPPGIYRRASQPCPFWNTRHRLCHSPSILLALRNACMAPLLSLMELLTMSVWAYKLETFREGGTSRRNIERGQQGTVRNTEREISREHCREHRKNKWDMIKRFMWVNLFTLRSLRSVFACYSSSSEFSEAYGGWYPNINLDKKWHIVK